MSRPQDSKVIDTNICTFAEQPPEKTDIQVIDDRFTSRKLIMVSF